MALEFVNPKPKIHTRFNRVTGMYELIGLPNVSLVPSQAVKVRVREACKVEVVSEQGPRLIAAYTPILSEPETPLSRVRAMRKQGLRKLTDMG